MTSKKVRSARIHTSIRADQRFSLKLNQFDMDKIIHGIKLLRKSNLQRNMETALLFKQSETRSLYAAKVGDLWVPIVYSMKHDCIVTVLPENTLTQFEFVQPRLATQEEQKEAFLSGKKIPEII